jgi:hypothetical protein
MKYMEDCLKSGEMIPKVFEPDVFQITAEAALMKRYLVELADACEERVADSKEWVREMGASMIRVLTGPIYGDRQNLEAIAAVSRLLLYILDETEKRAMRQPTKPTKLRLLPPPAGRGSDGNGETGEGGA